MQCGLLLAACMQCGLLLAALLPLHLPEMAQHNGVLQCRQ